jgi:hypothetical protein
MSPRGFWIALAVVVFYFIARPHVGTVWYERVTNISNNVPHRQLATVVTSASYASFEVCNGKAQRATADKAQERRVMAASGMKPLDFSTVYDCVAKTALLWGW